MEAKLFTKDEEIINEYSLLIKKNGNFESVLPAIENLIKQISQEMHNLWKPILNGLQYLSRGDGFEMPSAYNHTEDYLKAYDIFCEVISKIENKESLLFLFITKMQITCLALSRSKNTEEIISLFDNLINKFQNNKNEHFQIQIASVILHKSFVIWEVNKNNITNELLIIEKNIEDELINTFSSSDNPEIHNIVSDCLHNKANSISKEIEINERKRIDIYSEIIKRSENCEDERSKIQLSKALSNKVFFLEELKASEELKNKWKINFNKDNYEPEINKLYLEIINKTKHSTVPVIQLDYILASLRMAELLKNKGQTNEALRTYNSIIKRFNNSNDNLFLTFLAEALIRKAFILESQARQKQDIDIQKEAIKTYDKLLELKFINYNSFQIYNDVIHFSVTTALSRKIEFLIKINNLDDALSMIEKAIAMHLQHKDNDLHFLSLFTKIRILLLQAENNKDNNKYKQAIDVSIETLNLYKNIGIDCQDKVALIMMNMASAHFNIGLYQDAIKILKEVINIYGSKKFQIYENFQQIVHEATQSEISIEYFLPIIDIFKYYPSNDKTVFELIESIRKNNVIPIIGAGLSAFAGYPLWKEFLLSIFKTHNHLFHDISKDKFLSMSCKQQASCLEKYIAKGIFENEVKRYFSDKDVNEKTIKNQPVWLLPKLFEQQIILTTNFDNLIKLVFGMQKITTFEQCTRTDIDKINNKTNISTLVYKINGTVDSFKDVILTEKNFTEAYDKNGDAYKGMQKTFQHNKDVLFLGCSLEEKHEILDFIKDKNITIFTIYPCENDNVKKAETIKVLGENGITSPILYPPEDNHFNLFLILQYISSFFY